MPITSSIQASTGYVVADGVNLFLERRSKLLLEESPADSEGPWRGLLDLVEALVAVDAAGKAYGRINGLHECLIQGGRIPRVSVS